jgi:DHA1 family multidrug resistance protein-like MFS transporter
MKDEMTGKISKVNNIKPAIYSSLAMAFAGMGDAFLYPFLPLYAPTLNIPLAWVGILLSVNRFARILLSPLIIKTIRNFGLRSVTISACILAICSTFGYGLNLGLTVWLFFRIMWGLCFSALRISTASYAIINSNQGLAVGLSNGIYEIGPMLALWIGPIILFYFETEYIFHLLALLSMLAFYFAYNVPSTKYIPPKQQSTKIKFPSIINILTFLTAFVAEGVLIITLTLFIQQHYKISSLNATSIGAGFLLFRRIGSILVSPAAGILAEHFGFKRILTGSLLAISTGIILLVNNIFVPAVITIFCFNIILNAIFPIIASRDSTDKIGAIAQNSIGKDAGAAIGTLVGGFLLSGIYLKEFLLICSFLQLPLVIYYSKRPEKL